MRKFIFVVLLVSAGIQAMGINPKGFYLDSLNNHTNLLSVKCIGQDKDGLIWFGTDKGLYNYNGYSVKSYLGRISNIQTRCILVVDGTILLGYNGGLLVFDIVEEKFKEVDFFRNDIVNTIIRWGEELYIGADSGLYRVDAKEVDKPGAISKLVSVAVRTMLLRKDGIWIGTFSDYGYYSFDAEEYYAFAFEESAPRPGFVSTIYAENDSTLWMGTSRAMIHVDVPTRKATQYMSMIVLQTIMEDESRNFLLGTDAGLFLHDRSSGQTVKLRDGIITSSFLDKEGNYWLGTDNGLLLVRRKRTVAPFPNGGFSPYTVAQTILLDRKDRFWVGGLEGIQLYEMQEEGAYVPTLFYSVGNATHPIPQKVNKIVEDDNTGDIYVASDGGLLRFDETSRQFIRITVQMDHNWVYDMLAEEEGMWLASYDGLFHIREGKSPSHLSKSDGLSTNDITQVVKDRTGQVWCRTRDQMVYRINPDTGLPEQFDVGLHAGNRFADVILCSMEGTIWIASENKLLQVHSLSDGDQVDIISLPSNPEIDIYSLADIQGRIWVCSSDGIFFVNKRDGVVGRFSVNKSYICLAYDREADMLLAGTTGGVDTIPFSEIERLSGERPSQVYISSVIVNNTRVISKNELASGKIVLDNKENFLDISLSDYKYGSNLPRRFIYRLGEKDAQWREVISNNIISLSNLKSGRYALQICSGFPSEDMPSQLMIVIRRPGYLSMPMLLLYSLVLAGAIYVALHMFRLRNRLFVEQKKREIMLNQFRQKEEFFTNVSHEFKTPLSLIIAPLNQLLHESDDKETTKMLTLASENANKLNSLVHNSLDYYRATTDSPATLIKVDMDFVEFVKSVFDSYKENYPRHEFIFNSNQSRIVASIDYAKMEMAVSNLLSNACKYTPEGGSVILSLDQDTDKDLLVMKLSDTGIGIPNEDIPFIFRRYYESSRTKGRSYDSTGVGLSIIKSVVENHSGHIYAESDDFGSTFTMILPCKDAANEDAGGPGTQSTESDKPLIVIVEDNVQMSQFLESMLSAKYKCISSSNGKSGLKLCKAVCPDLIISDVMMPVMDGLEMCRQVRECTPLSLIPIILLTAKGDVETEKKSISLNIESFIPKPFDLPLLLSKIDQLLGNRRRMEQKLRMDFISLQSNEVEISQDDKFIQKVTGIIEDHIDDSDFSVSMLCEEGGFSEKQLYRKVKEMTGLSTAEYIRSIRLKKAAMLLKNGNFTIAEVMYSVGFSNASYFTRSFSSEFGKTPSEYKRYYRIKEK